MLLHDDQRGVTGFSIMLLALLVLAVVLLNGISISVKQQEKARAADTPVAIAQMFCNTSYRVFPPACKVSKLFQCDSQYLLETNCLGVGKVILDKSGNEKVWCDFTSFEGVRVECAEYWKTEKGDACPEINNLCQK